MRRKPGLFERFSSRATQLAGSTAAFISSLAIILAWAVTGPIFRFSDTWQLVINTGTTIATFLMVFLIQRSQNKDAAAIHVKLNEIVSALPKARNALIDVEDCAEHELHELQKEFAERSERKP